MSIGAAGPGVPRCWFLVLSEDSAGDAHDTLVALAKKILRAVDHSYDDRLVGFAPAKIHPGALPALRGNAWKNTKAEGHRDRVALIRAIATTLLEGDRWFVLFHIDGDRMWADRETSENVAKFRQFIETAVCRLVEDSLRKNDRTEPREVFLSHLLTVVPYYSIESWLFQHTAGGKQFCQENQACKGKEVELFEKWEQDRALLDEVWQPKKQVCFKDRHNRQLAEGLDLDPGYYAAKSLYATVTAFQGCAALITALEATRPGCLALHPFNHVALE